MQRKPSHFGSYSSSPSGRPFTDLASIGATGGESGRSMPAILARRSDRQDGRVTPTTRARALAALLTTTGVTHFVAPRPYARIVPRGIGSRYGWVYASGAAELACAAALLPVRTRRPAAAATA